MLDQILLSLSARIEKSFREAATTHQSPAGKEGRGPRFKHALLAQLFSHFRAIRTLVCNGHDEEAKIILRSMTDLVIRLAYLNRFPEHWKAMIKQGYKQSKKGVEERAKLFRNDPSDPYLDEDQKTLDAICRHIEELEAEEGEQPDLPNLFALALAADSKENPAGRGFQLLHRTHFFFFSDNAHAHPNALARYVGLDPAGEQTGLLLIPPPRGASFALYHGSFLFLSGWDIVFDTEAEIRHGLRDELERLAHHATSGSP